MAGGDLTARPADAAANEIGLMSRSVNHAVSQMRATMQGLGTMSGDLHRAADGTTKISEDLAEVRGVTAATRDAAHATEETATDLADISQRLRTIVADFRF